MLFKDSPEGQTEYCAACEEIAKSGATKWKHTCNVIKFKPPTLKRPKQNLL